MNAIFMQATVPFILKRERHHYRQAERDTARVILQKFCAGGAKITLILPPIIIIVILPHYF